MTRSFAVRSVSSLALLASLAVGSLLATACVVVPREVREVVVTPSRGNGPPAHAPAHGYRRKLQQDGVTLEFDSGRNVYVVVELEDVFFFEKRYFRCSSDGWYASVRPNGGWVVVAVGDLPVGLRDTKPRHGKPGKAKKH